MCPATIALVGVAASAAGALGTGISSAESASYQAQVAKNNAQIARQNAQYSAGAGAAQTETEGLKARAASAAVEAGEAANNLDVGSGSPADVLTSERELGALDTATVANRAAETVYGYQTQAAGFQAQSELDQSQVGWDIAGGLLKAGGDVGSNPTADSTLGSLLSPSSSTSASGANLTYTWMQGPLTGGTSLEDLF